jgi:hypothetical protein
VGVKRLILNDISVKAALAKLGAARPFQLQKKVDLTKK